MTESPNRRDLCADAAGAFRRSGGVLRTRDALRQGIHPRTLYAMRDGGLLERLGRGVYRLADLPPLGDPDLVTVAIRIPTGVLCLLSAAAFHEITMEIPHQIHIALKRGAESPRLEHPPLRVFWFSGLAYSEGIETHQVDGQAVRVYSAAKTVADCFKYRNKLGLDVALDALKLFLRDKRGSPAKLMQLARVCRVERVIRPYLEALL